MPFDLGRPLGSAADPEFQKQVIRATLALLETASEPTIEDYPIDGPDEAGPGQWSCPLSLDLAPDESLAGRLAAEVDRLRPWSAQTRADRGRTFFGASGAGIDQVDEVAAALGHLAEAGDVAETPPGPVEWAFDMPLLIRHLADDLRGFYHEAIAAQPGPDAPNHEALNQWIFGGTVLGQVFTAIADKLTVRAETEPSAKLIRGLLIPEGHYRQGSAF